MQFWNILQVQAWKEERRVLEFSMWCLREHKNCEFFKLRKAGLVSRNTNHMLELLRIFKSSCLLRNFLFQCLGETGCWLTNFLSSNRLQGSGTKASVRSRVHMARPGHQHLSSTSSSCPCLRSGKCLTSERQKVWMFGTEWLGLGWEGADDFGEWDVSWWLWRLMCFGMAEQQDLFQRGFTWRPGSWK